jgi:hypothetical protein
MSTMAVGIPMARLTMRQSMTPTTLDPEESFGGRG